MILKMLSILTYLALIYIKFRTWKFNRLEKIYRTLGECAPFWLLSILERIFRLCGCKFNVIVLPIIDESDSHSNDPDLDFPDIDILLQKLEQTQKKDMPKELHYEIIKISKPYKEIFLRTMWCWKYNSWSYEPFRKFWKKNQHISPIIHFSDNDGLTLNINLKDKTYYFRNFTTKKQSNTKNIIFNLIEIPREVTSV
jgi:hypothetical protein